MAISDEHLTKETPPAELWAVTRERTRAGKPPSKIKPFKWVHYHGCEKPSAVMANRATLRHPDGVHYSLPHCFISLEEAVSHQEKIIADEIAHEERKLREIRGKLRQARRAALELCQENAAATHEG